MQNARLGLPRLSEDDNFNNSIHVVTTEIVLNVENNAIECTVELCNVEQRYNSQKGT